MTDDIVARLRLYANASIDGGWASVFRADLTAAADEIERLRAERDEARREICKDEADLISLELGGAAIFAASVAKRRGWDCFKEDLK